MSIFTKDILMGNLQVIFSNRIEKLVDVFADKMRVPVCGDDFLTPETVLLDNKVLGQWLNMQLAEKHGVAANIDYIQPSSLFWKLAKGLLGAALPDETPLLKEEMKWRLFALLADEALLALENMQPVKHYLHGDDCKELKRFQLASSIADLFDQYLIFRPDWLLAWQQGSNIAATVSANPNESWQKELWQRLLQQANNGAGVMHRAAIEQQLHAVFTAGSSEHIRQKTGLKRLLVFGISSMSPQLLQLLDGLGQHIDVCLLVLNPCEQYWELIQSAREVANNRQLDGKGELYFEIGNPLLASQGVQVREFIQLLQEHCDFDFLDHNDGEAKTLLQQMQQEILHLHYKGQSACYMDYVVAGEKQLVTEAGLDRASHVPSIHIHQCHSPQREVEVLHDQLRDMLRKIPGLNPRDIVVMMPAVANYVPYIHAVFNSVEEKFRIPYQVADRTLVEESPLLNSFVTLLDIADSRMLLSEVLAILEVSAVQKKLGMDNQSFELLRHWLVSSGARWGVDAAQRQRLGLPPYHEYTWEFAIQRLLAGYAIALDQPYATEELLSVTDGNVEISPFDEVEGGGAALLESFLQFWNRIQALRNAVSSARSLRQWHDDLMLLLQDFYEAEDDDDKRALTALRTAINQLSTAHYKAWYKQTVGIAVIRDLLKPALQQPSTGKHQWQEGIKFCSLLPMRAVPFRVVYIMGMNLDDYPRRVERKSFDLMRNSHRPGDRASRIDDRWLFLEALLSAREVFHVSYIARDMHRNQKREPSVVLSELMDYLRYGYRLPGKEESSDKLDSWFYTEHGLQPFSEPYFYQDKSTLSHRLFSFDQQAFAIANAKRNRTENNTMYQSRWQPASATTDTAPVDIAINDFVKFFSKPWDWFFSSKYKLNLDVEDDGVQDEEAYTLGNGLDQWAIKNNLLGMINQRGGNANDFRSAVDDFVRVRRAKAQWPVGLSGEQCREELLDNADFYYAAVGKEVIKQQFVYKTMVDGVELCISGDMPVVVVNGKAARLFFHSPSKGATSLSKSLELWIKVALAFNTTQSLNGAEAIFFDGEKVIESDTLGDLDLSAFLQQLCSLYMQYRHCGLPFDVALAKKLVALAEDAPAEEYCELVDDYWYGDGFNAGANSDAKKRIYFAVATAVYDECFIACCRVIVPPVLAFDAHLDEAGQARKAAAKKNSKEEK